MNIIQRFILRLKGIEPFEREPYKVYKKQSRLEQIEGYAKTHGWQFLELQEPNRMISFSKDGNRLNVYYSTGTVGTVLTHPKRGRSTLYRRHLTMPEIEQIFSNPRIHTQKGYYTK